MSTFLPCLNLAVLTAVFFKQLGLSLDRGDDSFVVEDEVETAAEDAPLEALDVGGLGERRGFRILRHVV